MKTPNPTYLFKSRHGIYYCRVRIPLSIKKQYNTPCNEVKRSLRTRNYSEALKGARRLWVELERTDFTMNDKCQELEQAQRDSSEGRQLLKRFLIASIQSNETEILDDEEANHFTDYENSDSDTKILFKRLSSSQQELLQRELDSWEDLTLEKKKVILESLKEEIKLSESVHTPSPATATATEPMPEDDKTSPLLPDAIEKYIEHYIGIRSRGNDPKPVPKETIAEYSGILREFIRIIEGEKFRCSDLSKKIIKGYDQKVWKVPAGFMKSKAYKGKSVDAVIAMGKKTKESDTISKHVMRVKSFLSWCENEDYSCAGLGNSFSKIYSGGQPDHEKRDPFSNDELRLLFNNPIYEAGRFKHPSRYWLPLIALFTGMRGREIAQLYRDDVQEDSESGVWFIEVRFNQKRMQSDKTAHASRKIPVHPQLKKLGFIEYVSSGRKNTMLFPELYNESGNPYKNWGNNFNRKAPSGWKWKLGVKGDTVFHSFRHNVIDFLEKADVHKRIGCFLVGHKYKGGFVSNYIKSDDLKVLHGGIKVLSYPSIDWSKIEKRRW